MDTYKTVFQTGDGSVRKTSDLSSAISSISTIHPGGVNSILIGVSSSPGWKQVQGQPGIIAILIGLLLPAVQKVALGQDSRQNAALIGLLRKGGTVGIGMCDGSVRPIGVA